MAPSTIIDLRSYRQADYKRIATDLHSDISLANITFNRLRPTISRGLLQEYIRFLSQLQSTGGAIAHAGSIKKVRFIAIKSSNPDFFNLGLDLARVKHAAITKDEARLRSYAELTTTALWETYRPSFPVTTIALVQGNATGAGFEFALACDYIIAEEKAKFSFPEATFDLFAGFGGLSFLARKVGVRMAKKIIGSGKVYTAKELHKLGVVDVVAQNEGGIVALYKFTKDSLPTVNSMQAINNSSKIIHKLEHDELIKIGELWVETVMKLSPANLEKMDSLIRAQNPIQRTA